MDRYDIERERRRKKEEKEYWDNVIRSQQRNHELRLLREIKDEIRRLREGK